RVTFSPDNLLVATAGDDREIHTWNADNGMAIETFKGHKGPIFTVAFAGNGTLVSGGADRSAVIWDLNPGWTLERTIGAGDASSPISDRVNALRFSPGGKRLPPGGGEPTRGGDIKIFPLPSSEGERAGVRGSAFQSFTNVH